MKQLTQSEIRKNGKVYKNVSSPETSGTLKQVTDIVEDNGTFSISTDGGKTYSPAGGAAPEALPQEASALKSGNLPINGWSNVSAPLWEGNAATTDSEILQGNIGVVWNSVDDMPLTGWTISYAYTETGGSPAVSTASFTKENNYIYKTLATDNHILKIYPNGNFYFTKKYTYLSKIYVTKIEQSSISKQGYTISDTAITANSDILMELTDEGGVKAYSMEAGKMTVIRDTVPTQPIPYTYKVKQTNASGQFTLVNHFVPSVPESPTSLPVTYKKASGELPRSGWSEIIVQNLLTKNISVIQGTTLTETNKQYSQTIDAKYYGVLQGWKIALSENNKVYDAVTAMVTVGNEQYMEISYKAVTGFKFNIYLDKQGNIFYAAHGSGGSTYTFSGLSNSTVALHTYTISDTSITANTSVKMYLTDEGGVKAYSKESGAITVIRDEVPTTAIPYEYEVEQTSAEGLFEVINAYVPDVPSKTSDLTNDSGFLTKNNIVAGDNVTVTDENGNVKISATGGGSGGGGIGNWQKGTADTELEDGTYLVAITNFVGAGIVRILDGQAQALVSYYAAPADNNVTEIQIEFNNKKYEQIVMAIISSGSVQTQAITDFQEYQYIKLSNQF